MTLPGHKLLEQAESNTRNSSRLRGTFSHHRALKGRLTSSYPVQRLIPSDIQVRRSSYCLQSFQLPTPDIPSNHTNVICIQTFQKPKPSIPFSYSRSTASKRSKYQHLGLHTAIRRLYGIQSLQISISITSSNYSTA